MRFLTCLLLSAAALGQSSTDAKVFTFNRADTEHCRVVVANGKPLLESTYGGTSVAVGLPLNRGNGKFSVFVAVLRADDGAVQVNPKDFYGLYSDAAHTRFTFYDESTGMPGPAQETWISAASGSIDPGLLRPGGMQPAAGSGPSGGGPAGDSPSGAKGAGSGLTVQPIYFHSGKIKQGGRMIGWITLRPPKGSSLQIGPTDMLGEVDIQVNGTRFRF